MKPPREPESSSDAIGIKMMKPTTAAEGLPAQRRQSARHRERNQHLHQAGVMVVVDVGTKCPTGALHHPVNQPLAREELEDGEKRQQKRVRDEGPTEGELDRMSLLPLQPRRPPRWTFGTGAPKPVR